MFSVAARDISAGEELHDCYGLPWYSVARATRQDITSRLVDIKTLTYRAPTNFTHLQVLQVPVRMRGVRGGLVHLGHAGRHHAAGPEARGVRAVRRGGGARRG